MADKPQPHPGYVGMLGLTCVCMLVGIVAMALEANEYDWDPKPKTTTPIALPKAVAQASDGAPEVFAEAKPDAKPTVVAKTEPTNVEAPKASLPPLPAILPPAATVKSEPKPATVPTGPVPSPLAVPFKTAPTPAAAPKAEPKPEEKKEPQPNVPTPSPLRIGR